MRAHDASLLSEPSADRPGSVGATVGGLAAASALAGLAAKQIFRVSVTAAATAYATEHRRRAIGIIVTMRITTSEGHVRTESRAGVVGMRCGGTTEDAHWADTSTSASERGA